jgi:hypothetical protein
LAAFTINIAESDFRHTQLQGYFTALFELDLEAVRTAKELLRSPAIGWPVGPKAELLLKDQRYQRVKIDLIDT